ncbi:MAG: hypothetical protein MZW92_76065 [Comamonadaceae bacterium]|nr:hypothetical protein [Comamonadaceae bacterium]
MGTALADRMFHFNVQTVDRRLPRRTRVAHGLRARGDGLPEGAARQARRHRRRSSPTTTWSAPARAAGRTSPTCSKSGLCERGAAPVRAGPHRRGQRRRVLRRAARDPGRRGRACSCWPRAPGAETARAAAAHARRPVRPRSTACWPPANDGADAGARAGDRRAAARRPRRRCRCRSARRRRCAMELLMQKALSAAGSRGAGEPRYQRTRAVDRRVRPHRAPP